MKKIYKTENQKKYNLSKSINQSKRRLNFKKHRKKANKSKLGKPRIKSSNLPFKDKNVITKIVPSNFSFLDNTDEVLKFFKDVNSVIRGRKNLFIDFQDVVFLTNDALVLLLSYFNTTRKTRGTSIRGNAPNDPKLKKIFYESGIFDEPPEGSPRNYIHTRKNKKADGNIADDLIRKATLKIFGTEGRCPGIYRALMECMSNTCCHAQPKSIGTETWWLTVYNNTEEDHVSFAFIDLGVGIFNSNKMRDFGLKFSSFFGFSDNKDLLREILNGRQQSSTKISYRGKGLPTIVKGEQRNYYSNLQIISNNVKAKPSDNQYITLKEEFEGTFLYWELKKENIWLI